MISFMISVVPPTTDTTWLGRQRSQSRRRAADWWSRRSRRAPSDQQTAAFARCDPGSDHLLWDHLGAAQLANPQGGPNDHAEPATTDIPALSGSRRSLNIHSR
jgi:hypothetical protein